MDSSSFGMDDLLDGNSESGWNIFYWLWFGMSEYPLLDWFCGEDGVWKGWNGWKLKL